MQERVDDIENRLVYLESEITDKSFLNKDLWVFDESKFIGSYYELYKIIINMDSKFMD